MAKAAPDATLDALLEKIATATRLSLCSAQPANFAAIAGVSLGDLSLTAGDGNGDYTIADGSSGRKITIGAQTISVGASGTATHFALDDGSSVIYVTTVPSQAVTSGGSASVGAWTIQIDDPLAAWALIVASALHGLTSDSVILVVGGSILACDLTSDSASQLDVEDKLGDASVGDTVCVVPG